MENTNRSSSHAVYNLKLHIVFVTKYRRKTLSPDLLEYLEAAFGEILAAWRCKLLEFGGEADHVHLLIDIHPLIANDCWHAFLQLPVRSQTFSVPTIIGGLYPACERSSATQDCKFFRAKSITYTPIKNSVL